MSGRVADYARPVRRPTTGSFVPDHELPLRHPSVRVVDASLLEVGGPARLVLSSMPRAREIADAVSAARGVSSWSGDRLEVTAVPARLVDAAGRVGGGRLARLVERNVDAALDAWRRPRTRWRTAAGDLDAHDRPLVMGVLNVTPDSFSDGGLHLGADGDPSGALAAGRTMVEEGADIVDVGGVSTRPGADPVPVEVELRRTIPVVEALAADGTVVSIDTTSARVAAAAIEAGAAIVNDVSAGRFDPDLLPTVAASDVGYVLMHMQGDPITMQVSPSYTDVVAEVTDFLAAHVQHLEELGIDRARVAIDPGIGFGKRSEHNLALLANLRDLASLACPVLVGVSRKSFIGSIAGVDDPLARLPGSLAIAALAVRSGARIVRVHDVAPTVQAVTVVHAVTTSA